MIKKILFFLLALSVCLPLLSSCQKQREITYYQYFDTVITLSAERESRKSFDAHVQSAETEIFYYHKLFDIYHEYSGMQNLASLNRTAGSGTPLKIEPALFDFLSECVRLYMLTGGHTNVMMGAVTSLWNEARENAAQGAAALPSEEILSKALAHTDIESLVLDAEQGTAYITDPQASIDVGAFAKGYAAERVAEHLSERGVKNGFVLNFGGNLRVIGGNGNDEPFTSGILNPLPNSLDRYALLLSLFDSSLVTSGSYFRYFEIEGERYHHLIDPATARPASTFVSVSVLGKDSGLCDALSTALFVMDLAEGEALMQTLEGYEAVWILPSGALHYTDGVEGYIVENKK